jgi:uncharacterized protein (TIGR02996 family)
MTRMIVSPEQSFLDALRDDPFDDTTRLVYADWLEDRDDPRGKFPSSHVCCRIEVGRSNR